MDPLRLVQGAHGALVDPARGGSGINARIK